MIYSHERHPALARHIWIPLVAASLLLTACQRKPEGQVVAVVNGDEITQGEVAEELKGANLPQGADQATVRQAAVQSLVQRRLLAGAARDEGVEKDPAFLVQRKQLEDRLLVQFLAQRSARTMARPDPGEVNAYIGANPGAFADRVIWTVNRLQFGSPKDPAVMTAIEGEHSLDAIVARLRAAGIAFTQNSSQLDSVGLTAEAYSKIAALPPGEPFVQARNGVVSVGAITGKQSAPITGDAARNAATDRLLSQRVNTRLEDRLKTLKAAAKIEYQKGFAPAPGAAQP